MAIDADIQKKLEALGIFRKVEISIKTPTEAKHISGNASAWVYSLGTAPKSATDDLGQLIQNEQQVYGVLIGIKHGTARTAEAGLELAKKRLAVRGAIFEWQPNLYSGEFELASSELVSQPPGATFYIERFKTDVQISKENLL